MKRFFILAVLVGLPAGLIFALDAARAQGPAQWGTVKGRIVWGGQALPMPAELKVDKDKAHCLSKGPILDEEWVVDAKTKGLRWTFVWLADAANPRKGMVPIHPALQKIKEENVEMDQPCCKFIPHVVALRQGQTLLVKNSSPIAHNFKYDGNPLKGIGGNPLMPPNQKISIRKLQADWLPIQISCSIHPWMRGAAMVFDHPYFAVSGENGSFEFKNAPAGKYRLMVRHSSGLFLGGAAGNKGRVIEIKADGVTDLGDLSFPPPEK
jgi:hypothetical protein